MRTLDDRVGVGLGFAARGGPLGHLPGDLPVDRPLAGQQAGQVAHQILERPTSARRRPASERLRSSSSWRPGRARRFALTIGAS